MAKTLELQFATESGKLVRISLENPKEPIDQAVVKQSMEQIIAAGVFYSANGDPATVQGARVIERNVTDVEIV
jgi:hypothetical protein